MELTYNQQPNRSVLPGVLLILILAILAFAAITVTLQSHAIEAGHAVSEVEAIRKCINNEGPFMQFVERDKNTFHLLCHLPDGRIGDQVVTKENGRLVEKTSFVPKDGTWGKILDWLSRKGATKFKGSVE